jgi:hypothetical protein
MLSLRYRGQLLTLPTLDGDVTGLTPTSRPTGFWERCIPHEVRFRKTRKATVAAVLRRFMASIYTATLNDGGWRSGVVGLRRYYRSKAPEHFRCEIPHRTAYNAVDVLIGCGMVERDGARLLATDEFLSGALSITKERAGWVPFGLLTPASPESKKARKRTLDAERQQRCRAKCTSQRDSHASSAIRHAGTCNPVTLSRATLVVFSPEVVSGTVGRADRPSAVTGSGPEPAPAPGCALTPDPPGSENPPKLVLIGAQPSTLPLTKKAVRRREVRHGRQAQPA